MRGDGEVTVFVVDDDPGVLDSLGLLLRSDGLRSRGFASATAFLDAYDPDASGCLILDLRMPEMSGAELQSRLRSMDSHLPVIFVTAHGDVPTAVSAMKAGAVDFIQKPFTDEKLLDKVHQALELDAGRRRERAGLEAIRGHLDSLTPREREVLALVVEGKHNKNIARALGISQRTVEAHRARLMHKMDASSVPSLVQQVMRAATSRQP
ncbi:MAG: response regulator [Gemmatimonadetes bacterium]|nr:response regulator [Gemmatimonadota bacterium]